jgi:hypothetical protein
MIFHLPNNFPCLQFANFSLSKLWNNKAYFIWIKLPENSPYFQNFKFLTNAWQLVILNLSSSSTVSKKIMANVTKGSHQKKNSVKLGTLSQVACYPPLPTEVGTHIRQIFRWPNNPLKIDVIKEKTALILLLSHPLPLPQKQSALAC